MIDNVLIRDKVAGFIITGGQDNIQAVAGQMLVFFTELGFDVPQFPFIADCVGKPAVKTKVNRSLRWIISNSSRVITSL